MLTDEEIMTIAIQEALIGAENNDEVPIGAVIVKDGVIIAKAHNCKEMENCAIYHAEIVAIRNACAVLRSWRLEGCELYVTLEPCPMCSGAIINSRIKTVYFGAYDSKAGCCGSLYNLPTDVRFNHRVEVRGGLLQNECGQILSQYFKKKRDERKSKSNEGIPQEIN